MEQVRNWNLWSGWEPWRSTHEWRMYALGLGERWLKPDLRFVIVTPGRTGSDLLVELLDSHPDIVCDSEILYQRYALPRRFVAGRAARAALSATKAYGFKLACGHYGYQPKVATRGPWPTPSMRQRERFMRDLSDDGVSLFFLSRRNHLAQAVSLMVAAQTRFHWRQGDSGTFAKVTLDPVHVVVMANLFEETEQYLQSILAPLPHVRLVYEDDLMDQSAQQATVDLICGHLGLPTAPTSSNLIRLSPTRLEDAIANYREVADLVRSTRFACFLDEMTFKPA